MNSQIITNAKIYWPAFFWNMSVNVIRKNFKLFLQVINVTIIDEKQILKMLHNYFYLIENYVIIKKLIWFKIKYNARALARKLKLMMFSWNWDIRQVCTKDHHHCWQQEIFFCYNTQNATKCRPGKEIFQSMILYNTNKSPMRNIFFLYLS